jgi:hypothetical protein
MDWKDQLRAQLEADGERAVRDRLNRGEWISFHGNDGNESQQVVRQWLREKDNQRERREQKTFNFVRWTFWVALAAFLAAIVGVIATVLHK